MVVHLDDFQGKGHPLREDIEKMSEGAGVSLPVDTHDIPFRDHVMIGKVF